MKTNPDAYAARHRQLCERAEKQFLAEKKKHPKVTPKTVIVAYAAAVRCAIARRDNTGIAAVFAAQSAHIAVKFGACFSEKCSRQDTRSTRGKRVQHAKSRSSGGVRPVAHGAVTTRW